MKFLSTLIISIMLTSLVGCATLFPPPVQIGDTEAELVAKRGQPTNIYQDGNSRLLEYSSGPWGQETYMARIGPDRRVNSFEQVLTRKKFDSIKVDAATKQEVLRTIGAPTETSYLPLRDLEVWSYPYKESGVWDSIMHVHFDKNGVVRQMLNGPDPRFDPDLHFPFGILRR